MATMEDAHRTLRESFKLEGFRSHQEDIVRRLLVDNASALAILPTGMGKSLTYQLPALLLPGLTLVISPLLALMKDQVDGLVRKGIKAGRIDSSQSKEEYQEVMDALYAGELRLLYVAPERLNMEGFMATIGRFTIELLAVDESHCVSEWGDAFRPDYLKIARFAVEQSVKRVLCLTATATPAVAEDICRAFDIDVDAGMFRATTYRSNLHLSISSIDEDVDGAQRAKRAAAHIRAHPGPTIVYITTQANTEAIASALSDAGVETRAYHAGMDPAQRKATQEWFMASPTAVVCATIAFGMGIDKGNIRNIIHFNMPKTLEGYSQEIGRAGRDGAVSNCVLYLMAGDRAILENFARGNTPSRDSVRRFMQQVVLDYCTQDPQKGEALVINTYQYSQDFDIRDTTLSLLFAQLELRFGFLRAATPQYMNFVYKSPKAAYHADTSPAACAIKDAAGFGRTWYDIDVAAAARAARLERSALVATLSDWEASGAIELKKSQRRNRYLILKPLPTEAEEIEAIADQMFEQMAKREGDEVVRLDGVFAWAAAPACLPKGLATYFGDGDSLPGDATCGHCTVCKAGGAPAVTFEYAPQPLSEAQVTDVLGATPHRDDARFLARVAFGITSPRITREKLHYGAAFGAMSRCRWDDVLARFEREVADHAAANPDGAIVTPAAVSAKRAPKRKAEGALKTEPAKKGAYKTYGTRGGSSARGRR